MILHIVLNNVKSNGGLSTHSSKQPRQAASPPPPSGPPPPHHVNPHLLSQLQQPTLTGINEPKVTALSQFKLTCYDKSQPKLIQAPVFL